ncbi:MAG: hypothetical protein IJS28_00545 [Synergistaceae bacterium]|nr:hypothetical protein [Synergistaceae bacterium]
MYIYNGTGAMCGSYAFAQALAGLDKCLHWLEMSSGASFGIASLGGKFGFSRILTVFRDFSSGIDSSASLFGINIERKDFGSPYEAARVLFALGEGECAVCGPVNMSLLSYLPLSYQYRAADHFITFRREKLLHVSDSEGVSAFCISSCEELASMLSVKDVPEAEGRITLRKLSRNAGHVYSFGNVLAQIMRAAAENMCGAENCGQGSGAFEAISKITADTKPVKWSVPLSINLGHYQYRKYLAGMLIHAVNEQKIARVPEKLHALLHEAVHNAGMLRFAVRRKNYKAIGELLMILSAIEKETASYIEKVKT